MTATLAETFRKIGVVIPRLASSHAGERLACVAAVERILESAALDWHDLVDVIDTGARSVVAPTKPQESAPSFADMTRAERLAWLDAILADPYDELSPWESEFLGSLRGQAQQYRRLSDRQLACADKILRRSYYQGVRP